MTVLIKGFVQRSLERLHQDGGQTVLDTVHMLRALNQSILRQRLDKYLTIFYGIIDRQSARLLYASAGQFPSPLLGVSGTTRYLPGRGMPLGLFREPEIEAAAASEGHATPWDPRIRCPGVCRGWRSKRAERGGPGVGAILVCPV